MTIVAVPAAGTGNPSQPQSVPMVEVYDYLTLPGVPSSAQNAPGMAGKKVKVTLAYDKAQSAAPDSVTWLANEPVYATVTDPNGFWHVFLVPVNKINPSGTYYVVQIEGYATYKIRPTDIQIPAVGWQSSAITIDLPVGLGVSGFTLPGGTSVLGGLNIGVGEPGLDVNAPGPLLLGDNVATSIELGAPTTGAVIHGIRIVDQFPGGDLGAKITAADADLGVGIPGELWVSPGNYTVSTVPTISPNHCVRFFGGVITVTVTGGVDVFVVPNGASLIGAGFGGPQTQLVIGPTANISRLITNSLKDGTQEYAYVDGFNITASTGAVVTVAVVDLVSLFVNSGLSNTVINCNNAVGPGLRIAGGTTTGFGPLYLRNVWVLFSTADSILVTENNPFRGSCHLWLDQVTVEHQASGFHGIHLQGFGGLLEVHIVGPHYENNKVAAATTAAIYVDGAAHVRIEGPQLLAANLANKRGVWISANASNADIQVTSLVNPNLINPVLQDDQTTTTLGAVNVPFYYGQGAGGYGDFATGGRLGAGTQTASRRLDIQDTGASSPSLSRDIARLVDTAARAAGIGPGLAFFADSTYAAAIRSSKETSAADTANDLIFSLRVAGSGDVSDALKLTPTFSQFLLGQLYPAASGGGGQAASGILGVSGIPSNANGNNGDWCISDTGHLYFRRSGVWQDMSAAITAQSTPGNPIGTASTTGVMMGLAGSITPNRTGTILVIVSGDIFNNTINDGGTVQIRTGTGTAPTNGAALTGTVRGGTPATTAAVGSEKSPFSVNAVVTGLALGTAIWIDLAVAAVTGGTATVENISISAVEV